MPLGAEAQELFLRQAQEAPWEEAPCLSGFSPLGCTKPPPLLSLFACEGTKPICRWRRLLCTFPTEPCGFHRGNLRWVKGSRSDASASGTAAGRTRQGLGKQARLPGCRFIGNARVKRLQQSRGTLVPQCLAGLCSQSPQSKVCFTAPPRSKPTIGLDKVCRYVTVLANAPRPVTVRLQPCLRG